MKLAKVSDERLAKTFSGCGIALEWEQVMYNYLILGFTPGSFFTSLLANDAVGAISRSHPGNNIQSLKYLIGWIVDYCPKEAWGSYEQVNTWLKMPAANRRKVLEDRRLIFSEKEETFLTLQDQ